MTTALQYHEFSQGEIILEVCASLSDHSRNTSRHTSRTRASGMPRCQENFLLSLDSALETHHVLTAFYQETDFHRVRQTVGRLSGVTNDLSDISLVCL